MCFFFNWFCWELPVICNRFSLSALVFNQKGPKSTKFQNFNYFYPISMHIFAKCSSLWVIYKSLKKISNFSWTGPKRCPNSSILHIWKVCIHNYYFFPNLVVIFFSLIVTRESGSITMGVVVSGPLQSKIFSHFIVSYSLVFSCSLTYLFPLIWSTPKPRHWMKMLKVQIF